MAETHRPRITRHGTHCTCGVFCGSERSSWWGHADDRFLLDPTTRLNPKPRGALEDAFYSMTRAVRRVQEVLNPPMIDRESR